LDSCDSTPKRRLPSTDYRRIRRLLIQQRDRHIRHIPVGSAAGQEVPGFLVVDAACRLPKLLHVFDYPSMGPSGQLRG
jgi:hypothetical protein